MSFCIPLVVLSACVFVCAPRDEWSIEYEIWTEGPKTVYKGTSCLYMHKENTGPCMEYTFEIPPRGRLAGPSISSNPGEHMLGFDWVRLMDGSIDVGWCQTASDLQTLPVSVPRHFVFFVMQTEFGPDDLLKLLAEWGLEGSPWDLDNDGIVNGEDLMILLGGWKTDEGTA